MTKKMFRLSPLAKDAAAWVVWVEELSDYWEKYGPVIKEYRKRFNKPKAGENQEYLYDLFKAKSLG